MRGDRHRKRKATRMQAVGVVLVAFFLWSALRTLQAAAELRKLRP